MSEVEKLYKNAGIALVADVKFPTKDVNYNVGYLPFSVEKQLELIKWLMRERYLIDVIDTKKECFTDCNKCNYYQKKIDRTLEYRSGYVDATRDILQLFDIQECE